MMSHTWFWVRVKAAIVEIKAVFFVNCFIYLLAILLILVVYFRFSLISVVSFRPFRFVVSGFSTCLVTYVTRAFIWFPKGFPPT